MPSQFSTARQDDPSLQRRWHYPKTAVYGLGPIGRCAAPALACILLFGPVLFWPLVFGEDVPVAAEVVYAFIATALVVLAACALRYGRNARFVLTPRTITAYGLGAGVELPFAQIASLTATRLGGSGWTKVVLNAVPGARSITIKVENRHLRDDDLFTWLTSIPQHGGDAIQRPKPPGKSPLSLRALLALQGVLAVIVVVAILRYPINDARAIVCGYPPLRSLSLTEGSASWVGPCHPGGKSYSAYLPMTLDTAFGRVRESVDCDLSSALRASPTPHHVAIWRDRRSFSDGEVREVDVDGRAVRAYSDYIARDRRMAPFSLASQLLLLASIVLLVWGFVVSMRSDD
jgi:hypothetical protein